MWYIVIFVLTLRDSWLPCSALDYLFYLGEEIAQLDFKFNQLANGCLLLYALKVSLRTCLLKGFLRECAFFFPLPSESCFIKGIYQLLPFVYLIQTLES